MDPLTITTLLTPTALQVGKLLSTRVAELLSQRAANIAPAAADSPDQIRALFKETKKRLALGWNVGLIMTIVLFAVFVGMAITAVVTGLVFDKPTYSIIFGGVSAASFFGVVIWKPYDKMFQTIATLQRLDIVLAGLEERWVACRARPEQDRASCIAEANQAALDQMAQIKP